MKTSLKVAIASFMAVILTGAGFGTLQIASAAERKDGAQPGQDYCQAVLMGGGNSSQLKGKKTGSTTLWATSNSHLSIKDRTVDVDVKVTSRNAEKCKDVRVALTAWNAPHLKRSGNEPVHSTPTPKWITTQTLYSIDVANLKPGQTHTLRTQLPCDSNWQVDAFIINDTAKLPKKGDSFMNVHKKKNAKGVNEFKNMGAAVGTTKCAKPKPEPKNVEVCDTKTGKVVTVTEKQAKAERYAAVNAEECQPEKPETPEKPEQPEEPTPEPEQPKEQPKETPAEIPATGPASVVAGLLGSSVLAGGVTSYLRSKRNLKSAL